MNWKIQSNCPGKCMVLIPLLFCFLPLVLFGKNKEIQRAGLPSEAWEQVAPYLMSDTHPLKQTLDTLFSRTRVIRDRDSLVKAGFDDEDPQPVTGVIVTRHSQMPGYVFKIYTDDKLHYSRGRPEYTTWMLRARGATLIRQEIAKKGWEAYFKAPVKWIYALPSTPKAKPGHLQKNFILVEEDMEILPNSVAKKRWKDGTITPQHLQMLFHIVTKLGLRDCCKPANIPICKDGRIAFVDTASNLGLNPPFYERLLGVLNEELTVEWKRLIKESGKQGQTMRKK